MKRFALPAIFGILFVGLVFSCEKRKGEGGLSAEENGVQAAVEKELEEFSYLKYCEIRDGSYTASLDYLAEAMFPGDGEELEHHVAELIFNYVFNTSDPPFNTIREGFDFGQGYKAKLEEIHKIVKSNGWLYGSLEPLFRFHIKNTVPKVSAGSYRLLMYKYVLHYLTGRGTIKEDGEVEGLSEDIPTEVYMEIVTGI